MSHIPPFICTDCGLVLADGHKFRAHLVSHTTEREGYALYMSDDASDLTDRIIWPQFMEGTLEECVAAWKEQCDAAEKYVIRRIRIVECEIVETNIDPNDR